jgi:hypothetical protein
MESADLEQIIRQHVHLPPVPTGTGWYPVLCKVCNDRGHKGKRGGFRFDIGGNVGYHCFNCNHAAVYDPAIHTNMPRKMVKVLRAFSIPDEEWQQVLFAALEHRDVHGVPSLPSNTNQRVSIEPPEIPLPENFYPLRAATSTDKWATIASAYLEDRGVDPTGYPFMLAHKANEEKMKKWLGRVIIPIYKKDKLIFYIGRDLTGTKLKKYESPPVSRDKVICGFDRLFETPDLPLYIVEGWFDAYAIGGVAIIGNELSDAQIQWLNRSPRKKVYIPDRLGNGNIAAEQALRQGWYISTPDIGSDCKDMSDAVRTYGKLFVMKTIADNTATGFEAEVNLGVYCK